MKTFYIAAFIGAVMATASSAQDNGLNEGHLAALDADGDAAISKAEFDSFTSFAFTAIDVDQNGVISLSEATVHVSEERFALADTNGNGSVSEAEFRARMDASFDAADKDGDGLLN